MKTVSVKQMTKPEWRKIYDKSLEEHLMYFSEAAKRLGVHPIQIKKHDKSKTSPEEYVWYVRRFGGKKKDPEFGGAWHHHILHNPHHWQHWLIPPGKYEKPSTILMPEKYVVEMVADWMGSGRTYTGDWDMTPWLKENLHKVVVHPDTRAFLNTILIKLDYDPDDLVGEQEVWE